MDSTGLFSISMIILYLALIVAWIATLVKQIKSKEYIWFVLTLLFSPVFIVYWIVWALKN